MLNNKKHEIYLCNQQKKNRNLFPSVPTNAINRQNKEKKIVAP